MGDFQDFRKPLFITDNKQNSKSQWVLVGNIANERPCGSDGAENKHGTKHFSPGTKVYCLPAQWGDGYDQIIVIARHRGSKKFKTMIISSSCVENWRAKVVYNPEVIRRIAKATEESWKRNWESKEEVEIYVKSISDRNRVYARNKDTRSFYY